MRNKKVLLLALVFVVVLGGAYALYQPLSKEVTPNQLAAQETSAAHSDGGEQAAEEENILAPDFTVYDVAGSEVHLSDFSGKPIVLNFWASWCPPCRSEMGTFNEASAELEGDVQFLMLNVTDGSRETVEKASGYITEQGYTFPVFYDTALEASNLYGAYSLPTTYFIDAEGYIIAGAAGALDRETLQVGIDMIVSD